jgi:nucleotide-binding universal stress UspA family protein
MTDVVPSLAAGNPAPPETGIAIRRILWACDFSSCALDALRWVLPMAKAYESEITALHVMPTTVPPGDGTLSFTNPALSRPHLHHDVAAALDRYVAPAIAASVPTTVTFREGKPAREILDTAERLRADLVVLGTHGRGAFERSVIGSVAEAVVGHARCPVVTVPTPAVPVTRPGMPGTVLWATDFSHDATAALPYAVSIAAKGHADLVLMHAVEPDTRSNDHGRVGEGEQRLRQVSTGNQVPELNLERVVVYGSASPEILRIARERKAGLIVMGTRGSRTLHSILFGSTARRVIQDAPCPVLSLRRT